MFEGLFKKNKYLTVNPKTIDEVSKSQAKLTSVIDGMWTKCNKCNQILYNNDLIYNNKVCTYCGYHFRLNALERIEITVDKDSFEEINSNLISENPLDFEGYEEKIQSARKKLKINEAVVTGIGKIGGKKCMVCAMDSNFMMGSMGSVVGEKLTRAFERATKDNLPIIVFTTSGGARMQEGIFSLMQMAKVSAAVERHSEKGLLYIAVITDPTTGGVTASFAMQGDIIIGEKGALIGFAGKRVIEQTIKQKLPEGFQTAEFLLEHGFLDMVCERSKLRYTISKLLDIHCETKENSLNFTIKSNSIQKNISEALNIKNFNFEDTLKLKAQFEFKLTAYEKLKVARKIERPNTLDYINKIFNEFIEFHGDRLYGDDSAIIGGVAYLDGRAVTVIGHQKGANTEENIKRNFGMPNPEGYRKALRLMKQAEKFKRPVICFIDTPGAFCGVEAEKRGQGEAIAKNLLTMSSLKTPIISIVIGEGGSGGALALAVADEVWMLDHAIYSVLSPEGFASILWKDSKKVKEAANTMKITAADLKNFGIIDEIIYEPKDGIDKNMDFIFNSIKYKLIESINNKVDMDTKTLIEMRYNKFRNIGEFMQL